MTTSTDSLYEDVWSAINRNQSESEELDVFRILGVFETIRFEILLSMFDEANDEAEPE